MQSPEIDPSTYRNLVYNKGGISNSQAKDRHFNKFTWDNLIDIWGERYNQIRTFLNFKSEILYQKQVNKFLITWGQGKALIAQKRKAVKEKIYALTTQK